VSLYKIDDETKADIYLNVFVFFLYAHVLVVVFLFIDSWMQNVPK